MVLQQWYGRSFRSCIKRRSGEVVSNMEITKDTLVWNESMEGWEGGWRASEFDEGFGETQEEKEEEETTCCENETKDCCCSEKKKTTSKKFSGGGDGKWIERKTIEGMPYYYNEKTEELTWISLMR